MFLTLIGIVAGLFGAFALTRYLESLLFGLTSLDPVTFSAMTLILILTAMVACYLPGAASYARESDRGPAPRIVQKRRRICRCGIPRAWDSPMLGESTIKGLQST